MFIVSGSILIYRNCSIVAFFCSKMRLRVVSPFALKDESSAVSLW